VKQLIEAHQSPLGKFLNGLDFPLPFDPHPPVRIASDLVAWMHTVESQGQEDYFPTASNRWALAATANTYHGFHINSDGLATYVESQMGSKWWVIACPANRHSYSMFSHVEDMFKFVNSEDKISEGYIFEAVLLMPGTRL
jgi:hypothetical protein